jgi:hypothetical protein
VINNFQEHIDWSKQRRSTGGFQFEDLNLSAFSDTLIISITATSGMDTVPLIVALADCIVNPFVRALDHGIFFRGVISLGEFCRTPSLLIGPAVDEAAEWYTSTDWIGVSAAPSAHFGLERMQSQGGRDYIERYFAEYQIPTKRGTREYGWAMAWPKWVQGSTPSTVGVKARVNLLDKFANQSIGLEAMSKYRNALAFFDEVFMPPGPNDEPAQEPGE